jgi:ubiquinone/menaquinone biosynthesis C-methylase UbiE
LQVEDGMSVLDVGCGPGIFCHRIKSYMPDTQVTGVDFDTAHIAYARAKSAELRLDCTFVEGDACRLPFPDETFDLCFSQSVMCFCEPDSFVSEQRRVLKPGGRMVILCGRGAGNTELWQPQDNTEEKQLFQRLWSEADKNEDGKIKRFEGDDRRYFEYLDKYGFTNIRADALSVVSYAPDSADVSEEIAVEQINECRLTAFCSIAKAKRLAPAALTDDEYGRLAQRINSRFDRRLAQYRSGEKLWDYELCTVLAISGVK